MIKKLLNSKSQNYFCSFAIGKKYFNNFIKYSYPSFKEYCKKNDIGIIVIIDHLIPKKDIYWKDHNWQKFLAPKILSEKFKGIKSICMIDTDVLINPFAPNIFKFHVKNKVSVVSIRNNLPFDYENTIRSISFMRNRFYSKNYLLDSAINISIKNLYKFHGLEPQKDEFCAGIYVVSKEMFNRLFNFFFKYKKGIKTITGGGEQTHFNYFVQKFCKPNVLNYKFQAIWVYEMSQYYSFLYTKKYRKNYNLINSCVENSIRNNYFLHFAGSWHESNMWKIKKKYTLGKNFLEKFIEYKNTKLTGKPRGLIKPK